MFFTGNFQVDGVNRTLQAVMKYVVESLNDVARDGLPIPDQRDGNATWWGLIFTFCVSECVCVCECGVIKFRSIFSFWGRWSNPGMDGQICLHEFQGRLEVS